MTTKTLIILGGPTGVGKTDFAIRLAKKFESEIISADGRQFYKELNIGVGRPNQKQLEEVNHYFIANMSIKNEYSVGRYEKDCLKLLNTLFTQHNILFLCGGSGLYIDSVCEGLNQFPTINKTLKNKILEDLEINGLDFLNKKLKKVDSKIYQTIDKQNPRRVIRALEVYEATGIPYSSYIKKEKKIRYFKTLFIALTKPRDILYKNINNRVDKMIKDGLINEVKLLYKYRNKRALQTIGYQELFDYLDGNKSLKIAINEIKKNSRRYAKRQINWFNQQKYHQFHINQEKEIIKLIQDYSK